MFIAGSILGMIIDLVFLTNLYQRKHPISNKKYWLMIGVMGLSSAIILYPFTYFYKIVLVTITRVVIIFLFTGKEESIGFFSCCFTIMTLIEVLFIESIKIEYLQLFSLNVIIKAFVIFIVFKELSRVNVDLKLKTITSKILYLFFCFLCLTLNIYFYANRRY